MEQKRSGEDEDSQADWTHLCKLNGGREPVLDYRNRRALNLFFVIHTSRTKDFPGAWQAAFETIDIFVDDYEEARFFLRAWDLYYSVISDVTIRRAREEAEKEERIRSARKPLKLYR